MSNEMIVREDDFTSSLMQIENTQKMCETLMRTSHYAKMGKDGIFAIVTTARSLGIDPIRALNGGLYFVQGRVGMSTELMASLIREKGHSIVKDPRSNASICILNGKRADNGDTWSISFGIEDAKRAGIYNDKTPWGKYPQIMMYNRCMSTLARQLFPDLIKGVGYEKDELEEIAKSKTSSYQYQQKEEVQEIKSESIGKEKADELHQILKGCKEEFVSKIWKQVEDNGFYSLEQISEITYEAIKRAAMNNLKPIDLPELNEIKEIEMPI